MFDRVRNDERLLQESPPTPNQLHFKDKEADSLYFAFLVLGVGSVLPSFIYGASVDYFNQVSTSAYLEFPLNAALNAVLFVFSVINALYLDRLGFTLRIFYGFIAMAACLGALPVLYALHSLRVIGDTAYYWLLIADASLLGAADACAQASLYGVTSAACPPLYTQALMQGVSVCGTSVTLLRVVIKLFIRDVLLSSHLFFAGCALYCLVSAAQYAVIRLRYPLFRRFLNDAATTSPTLMRRAYEVSPKGTVVKPAESMSFRGQVCIPTPPTHRHTRLDPNEPRWASGLAPDD